MSRAFFIAACLALTFGLAARGKAQSIPLATSLKLDALVIVAHSDDETVITPFISRAVTAQKKKVGVLFIGSGAGGFNQAGRERGHALGILRREEAKDALRALGVNHTWFIGSRTDNGTSNPLTTLALWDHGAILQQVVRIVRATRPEVILTMLPAQVIGENHGDHQAAGIIATEAFDIASDPMSFPEQVSQFGSQTEGLDVWAPRKLYFFTDAFDTGFFKGNGPGYSSFDKGPNGRSYASMAAQSLSFYPTQFTSDLKMLFGVELNEVAAAIGTPQENTILRKLTQGPSPFWPDPIRFALAKSRVSSVVDADVFDNLSDKISMETSSGTSVAQTLEIGGPWWVARHLAERHSLKLVADIPPQLAISLDEASAAVPVRFSNLTDAPVRVTIVRENDPPPNWKEEHSLVEALVKPGESIEIVSKIQAAKSLGASWTPVFAARIGGATVGRAMIKLVVTEWTLPQ